MGYVSEWEKQQLKGIKFITKKQILKTIRSRPSKPKPTSIYKPIKPKIDIISVRPRQSKLMDVINIRKIIKKSKLEMV